MCLFVTNVNRIDTIQSAWIIVIHVLSRHFRSGKNKQDDEKLMNRISFFIICMSFDCVGIERQLDRNTQKSSNDRIVILMTTTIEELKEALRAKTKFIEAQNQIINQYEKMLGIEQWGAFVVVVVVVVFVWLTLSK